APNSIHPSGKKYEIIKSMDITKIDKIVIDRAFKQFYTIEQLKKQTIIEGTSEGLRNESMFKIACSLKSKDLSAEETLATLKSINEKNTPPLPEHEIKQIIQSAYSYKIQKKIERAFEEGFSYLMAADNFLKMCPMFYDNSRLWWIWDENECFWKNIDETDLLNAYSEVTGTVTITKGKVKNQVITALQMKAKKNHPKEAKIKYIQFKDKVVNIDDNKIYPVENRFFFTNPIPWKIGKSDKTPVMDKLFEEWVGKDYVQTLYEILAYCCYRNYPIQVLF
ncbi:unnamed protein product, partial [marine sediment metagenome]